MIRVPLMVVSVLLVVGTAVTAAQAQKDGKQREDHRPVLRMGLHVSQFNTLDPHKAASTSDRILADMVFNGLIRYQPGNSDQMEPDLALEIPDPIMVRGKQTWIFRLKRGIYFHSDPGEEPQALTAVDVCRSFIKSSDPERSDYAGGYENISVTVTGSHTLRFTVDPPQSPLLFLPKVANYAGGFIVKEVIDDDGRHRFKGTGPFQLAGFEMETNTENARLLDMGKARLFDMKNTPPVDTVNEHGLPSAAPDHENSVSISTVNTHGGMGYRPPPNMKTRSVFTEKAESAGEDLTRQVNLVAHDAYFRGKPLLAGVMIQLTPDPSKRLFALIGKKLDIVVGEPDLDWLEKVPADGDFCIDRFGVAETANIYFNTTFPPFSDVRVRKAVAFALDRTLFSDHFARGMVEPVYSPIPPFMPGGIGADEVTALGLDYPLNLERAKSLMREAGYPDGFSMAVVVSEVGSFHRNYSVLKAQLLNIGIDMTLNVTDHATMHRRIRQNVNPLVIYEAFRPNTDEYLSRFFHSSAAVSKGKHPGTNFCHYSGIDGLIEQARLERFTSRQIKLWEYAQIKLLEEMVVLPLFCKKQVYVRRKGIDYGHPLISTTALYPQFTEKTTLAQPDGGKASDGFLNWRTECDYTAGSSYPQASSQSFMARRP